MKIIKRTFRIAFKFAPLFTIGIFLLGIVQAMGNGFLVIQTQNVFDSISQAIVNEQSIDTALFLLILLFIVIIVIHLLNGLQNYLYDVYIMTLRNKLAYLLSEKASKINPILYEDADFLDLTNKAKVGMENSIELILVVGDIFTYYMPYFIFMMFYLYHIQKVFIIFIFLLFVPILIAQTVRVKLFSNLENSLANDRRQLKYFDSCISDKQYVKECRVLNANNFFIKKLKDLLAQVNKREYKANVKMNMIETILEFITLVGYICILIILVISFSNRQISLGAFAAIYSSLSKIFNMMEEILRYHIGKLSENIGSIHNFILYLNYEEMECERHHQEINSIELKHVSFHYPHVRKKVLDDINLKIVKNQTIALVGDNGSGKTTLSKIIMGLYPPTEGEVVLNHGENLNDVDYRKSCLFQKFQKYKLNLSTNIEISDLDNKGDIQSQIENFNLQEIDKSKILSPDFGGIDLSIGQWQRVSMARAFYRDSNFIILDEPTASIDPIEENLFYQKFHDLCIGKTALIITHHLVSAKYADLIVVLDKGVIVEQGTHQQLMNRRGKYYKMFHSQLQSYEMEEGKKT